MKETNNVILFPQTLETLEAESFKAIDEQDFEVALEKLNTLHAHQVSSYQINIGTLICFIKLYKLEEAEQFCERLLADKEAVHYYDYVEYYIMILYEKGNYNEVMEIIDEENEIGQMPNASKTKFAQLYEICYQMNETAANELINDFKRAIKERKGTQQWYIINKWRQLHIHPPEIFKDFLSMKEVHPVVKTNILETLQRHGVGEQVIIEKFGEKITVQPNTFSSMDEHPIYKKTLTKIQVIEQDDPTLYQLVKQLFDQHNYVHYPFVYPESAIDSVAAALIHIGKLNLSLPQALRQNDDKTNDYIKKIQESNELYLKIMLQ